MIGNKLTKWFICILMLIDFLHALTRVTLGHTCLDSIVLLVANVLWITVYLSLYSYLPQISPRHWVKRGLGILVTIQLITVVLIYLEQFRIQLLFMCIMKISLTLSIVQIIVLFVVGRSLLIDCQRTVIRYLSYALMAQSIATAFIFIGSRSFLILLSQHTTRAMMANFFSVLLDCTK